MMPNHIVDVESMDIFPVGWCESNNYPLKPPRKLKINKGRGPGKQVAVVQPEYVSMVTAYISVQSFLYSCFFGGLAIRKCGESFINVCFIYLLLTAKTPHKKIS